jgi:hypothetical protein
MDEYDLAYLAGIIDGEGHLTITNCNGGVSLYSYYGAKTSHARIP